MYDGARIAVVFSLTAAYFSACLTLVYEVQLVCVVRVTMELRKKTFLLPAGIAQWIVMHGSLP